MCPPIRLRDSDGHVHSPTTEVALRPVLSALIRSLLACATALTAVALPASPASAHGDVVYEINDHRHHAVDTQEEGRLGARSDEFYLVKVSFQVQIGVKGSTRVWRNDLYEIDDIDKGEYHSIAPRMGRSTYELSAWNVSHMITKNTGPWIFGEITQLVESDTARWSSIHDVHRGAAAAVRSIVEHLEVVTPQAAGANLVAQAVIDQFVPSNSALRADIMNTYVKGLALDAMIKALKTSGFNALGALRDDPIGRPHVSVFVGLHDIRVLGATIPVGAAFNDAIDSVRVRNGLDTDDVFESLPTSGRDYTQRFSGDGATYDISVAAGPA